MTDVKWRQVCTISALIVAFLLLVGAIYMHIRQQQQLQKQQLAQLGDAQQIVVHGGVEAANLLPTEDDAALLSALTNITRLLMNNTLLSEFMASSEELEAAEQAQTSDDANDANADLAEEDLSEACLQCICATATDCRPANCAAGQPCGPFRISLPYWLDAGKLTVAGDASAMETAADADDENDYLRCVNNVFCAGRTVRAFARKYARDCNQDGLLDCRDYIALHLYGPSGCSQQQLLPVFVQRMQRCLQHFRLPADVDGELS